MEQQHVRQCDWCDKQFTPVIVPRTLYNLTNAGKTICLDCCDKWEEAEIELHDDKIMCFLDEPTRSLKTFNGYTLSTQFMGWHDRVDWRKLKYRAVGEVKDTYGRDWLCERITDSLCALKPTRRHRWSV